MQFAVGVVVNVDNVSVAVVVDVDVVVVARPVSRNFFYSNAGFLILCQKHLRSKSKTSRSCFKLELNLAICNNGSDNTATRYFTSQPKSL